MLLFGLKSVFSNLVTLGQKENKTQREVNKLLKSPTDMLIEPVDSIYFIERILLAGYTWSVKTVIVNLWIYGDDTLGNIISFEVNWEKSEKVVCLKQLLLCNAGPPHAPLKDIRYYLYSRDLLDLGKNWVLLNVEGLENCIEDHKPIFALLMSLDYSICILGIISKICYCVKSVILFNLTTWQLSYLGYLGQGGISKKEFFILRFLLRIMESV